MKIYEVESADEIWVVIAETKVQAKKIVKELFKYDDEEDTPKLEVTEERDLRKGVVLNYDYEDLNWEK